jgi:hypothetical protein
VAILGRLAGLIVVRAVDEDRDGVVAVQEVGADAQIVEERLGVVGQALTARQHQREPAALEIGLALPREGVVVVLARAGARGDLRLAAGPRAQQRRDRVPIEVRVVALVVVRAQAVVAGGLAALAGAWRVAEVGAGVGIEVADRQGAPGDPGERVGLFDQAAQHAGAALGGLVEQELAPIARGRERLRAELAVLELELDLDGDLHRGLERGHQPESSGASGRRMRQLRVSSTNGTTRWTRLDTGSRGVSSSGSLSQ